MTEEKPVADKESAGGLWRQRDFLLLWGGQTVSEMGSAVTQLALPLTAVVLLAASTFQVGLLSAAATLAFAVVALPACALVDRRPKRGIMIACDAARLLIVGSVPLAWAAWVLTMWQLYAVALTAGVCTVFFDVSYQSFLPGLLKQEHLLDGNGKLGATQSFAQLAGPGLGGGLVGAFGAAGAISADAASYAISVASLLGIRYREPGREPTAGDATGRRSLRAEIAEGLRFVLGDPILRKIVGCTGTANLFSSIAGAVEIVFLIRVLHVRPAEHRVAVRAGCGGRRRRGSAVGPDGPVARLGPCHLVLHAGLRLAPVPARAGGAGLAGGAGPDRLRHRLLRGRRLQRGPDQLPAGDLPASPDGPDERGRPLDRLGHDAARRGHRRRARHRDRRPPDAVDWPDRQLGCPASGSDFSPLRRMRDVPQPREPEPTAALA